MSTVKISLIQTSSEISVKKTVQKTIQLIKKSALDGANIVCLQELFTTSYFCNKVDQENFKYAEPLPGPTTHKLSEIAKEHGIVILAPIFEKEAPGIYYNSMAVINSDGKLLGTYRKMHIPEDPGFHEKYYFTPGDLGYKVFNTEFGRIGTLICWDQWFPEAARLTAMKGADILIYPTAIATLASESKEEGEQFHNAWRAIQQSHAIANGCFVASINRVGVEEGATFWGGSFISGPFGEILAEGGDQEEIVTAEVDFGTIEKQRQTWPFFRDRRIDSYSPITKRFLSEN